MPRGRFTTTRGSGALTHEPHRYPIDRRGGGTAGGGGGTITGATNVNTRGVGVFHTQSGTVLQFRGVDSISTYLLVSLDGGDRVIDLDLDDAALLADFLAGLPDFARRDLPNTFLDTQTFEDFLDLRAIPDPGNPAVDFVRLFVRNNGANIELVSRMPTGAECVLCSHSATAGGGTLVFNGIEP